MFLQVLAQKQDSTHSINKVEPANIIKTIKLKNPDKDDPFQYL